jgi:two-component system sensor histidine kinase/response regulator
VNTKNIKIITILLLLFSFFTGYGQQRPATDTYSTKAEVDTLNSKGYKLIRRDAAKALLMFVKAEQKAEKQHYRHGLAAAYVNQAEIFNQRGYARRSLVLYYQALSISRQENDEYNVALCEQHISTVKRHLGAYDEASRLLNHALSVFIRLNKLPDVVNVQLRLGLLASDEKQYDKALGYYLKAYQNSRIAKFKFGEKKAYYDRALLYTNLNRADSALTYFNRALHIDTLTNDSYGKALSYLGISQLYFKQHNYAKAKAYAVLSCHHADSVNGNDVVKQAAGLMVDINRQTHNVAGVISWQDKLLTVNKLVADQERSDAVTFMDVFKQQQENQARYVQQIQAIKKVSSEKSVLIKGGALMMLIVLALIVPLHYNYRRARAYAKALKQTNVQIKEKSAAVEQLNGQILLQNKELEQDNNLKNKLLSVISHDLRHPLVNTRSLLGIYNQELLSQEEAKTLFGQLEAQYVRTITLLDNLLFWIKRQVQHAEAIKTTSSVVEVVSELIEEQRLALGNKNITVLNQIDPQTAWHTDREALRIVFRNLLNNALKFTPDKGTITFSSFLEGGMTGVKVKDSGIGMGPSKLKKVIQGSYMSTNGTAGEMGSGFGLILVRDLISKDEGVLDITSALGEGSEFTISFPEKTILRTLINGVNQEMMK